METFTLTEDHLTLLRHMYVQWQDCETGAPEVDPKRPYGNSSVAPDIAEILGHAEGDDIYELDEDVEDVLLALHYETETALQIVLVTGAFEPGVYEKTKLYNSRSWQKVADDA